MPAQVLDSEPELASSAMMQWLETATDMEVVMYAKTALQQICLLCRKPGHLAANCLNGCRFCGAKLNRSTGWALHEPDCLMHQRGRQDFNAGQKGAGGSIYLADRWRHSRLASPLMDLVAWSLPRLSILGGSHPDWL